MLLVLHSLLNPNIEPVIHEERHLKINIEKSKKKKKTGQKHKYKANDVMTKVASFSECCVHGVACWNKDLKIFPRPLLFPLSFF